MTTNTFWQYVLDHPETDWNYDWLSTNPNITWDIVKANPDKPWDYDWLSRNPNITWEIVKANPDKPWDYYELSSNPNITWDIVKANPDKPWDYDWLSTNQMENYVFPCCIMKRKAKERIEIIKEELMMKAWHPSRVEKLLEYYGMDWDEYI